MERYRLLIVTYLHNNFLFKCEKPIWLAFAFWSRLSPILFSYTINMLKHPPKYPPNARTTMNDPAISLCKYFFYYPEQTPFHNHYLTLINTSNGSYVCQNRTGHSLGHTQTHTQTANSFDACCLHFFIHFTFCFYTFVFFHIQ